MKETKNNETIHPIPRGVWESSIPGGEKTPGGEMNERGYRTASGETNERGYRTASGEISEWGERTEQESFQVGRKTVQAGITADLQGNGYPDPGKMLSESIEER